MPQVLWTEDNIASLYETVGTVGLGVAASLSGGPENSGAGGIPETLREDVLGDPDCVGCGYTSIPRGKPVVIIGESMRRVNTVAGQLRDQGYDVKTYVPRNFRSSPGGVNRLDLEANRAWLKYWTQVKEATVVDIGLDPGRSERSLFYALENRSLYQNWKYENVVKLDPGF